MTAKAIRNIEDWVLTDRDQVLGNVEGAYPDDDRYVKQIRTSVVVWAKFRDGDWVVKTQTGSTYILHGEGTDQDKKRLAGIAKVSGV